MCFENPFTFTAHGEQWQRSDVDVAAGLWAVLKVIAEARLSGVPEDGKPLETWMQKRRRARNRTGVRDT